MRIQISSFLLCIPSVLGQGRIGPSIGDTFRPNQKENIMKVEVPASKLQDLEYFDVLIPNNRDLTRLHHKPGSTKGSSWLGESSDGIYTISLVNRKKSGKDQVFGLVVDAKTGFVHQLSMDADGNSVLRSTHTNDFPPEQDPEDVMGRPGLQGTRFLRTADKRTASSKASFQSNGALSSTGPVDFKGTKERVFVDDSGSNLDVMVVWTKKAECVNSGLAAGCSTTTQTDANMRTLVALAIAETNTAYYESGVQTELRLVHAYLDSTYVEASSNAFSTALSDIRGTSDGEMDDVHAKRTEFGADIVAMLIDDSQYCGIGYIGPFKDYMFSVTAWNCATGYYSFGHEIGHNLGCLHDKGTSNACSSNNYNYGYRDPSAQFRSIMAYSCRSGQCNGNAGGGCTRVQRFSNPTYQYNNKAIGDSTTDNARQINDVKATVAAYYQVEVVECQVDADCDDQNSCTEDICDNESGGCTYTPIDGCCGNGVCESSAGESCGTFCDEDCCTESPTMSPTTSPTKNPTPSPTNPPTQTMSPTTESESGCCSHDFKECVTWCGSDITQAECESCVSDVFWIPGGARNNCNARYMSCTLDHSGCCPGLTCVDVNGDQGYWQCLYVEAATTPAPAAVTTPPTLAPTVSTQAPTVLIVDTPMPTPPPSDEPIATSTPTITINAPNPTQSPVDETPQPSHAPVSSAAFCCSVNLVDYMNDSDFCHQRESDCEGPCNGYWIDPVAAATSGCIRKYGECRVIHLDAVTAPRAHQGRDTGSACKLGSAR